eukprot:gene12645-16953_t
MIDLISTIVLLFVALISILVGYVVGSRKSSKATNNANRNSTADVNRVEINSKNFERPVLVKNFTLKSKYLAVPNEEPDVSIETTNEFSAGDTFVNKNFDNIIPQEDIDDDGFHDQLTLNEEEQEGETELVSVHDDEHYLNKSTGNFVVSSQQRSTTQNVSSDQEILITQAKNGVFAIAGFQSSAEYFDKKRLWEIVHSNATSQFWKSSLEKDGILLRGTTCVPCLPNNIANWLISRDLITGLNGIMDMKSSYITHKFTSPNGSLIVLRRMISKSGTLMARNRDFNLLTAVMRDDDGSYIVTTRSIADDFNYKKKGPVNGFIRGIVYCSGFLLRPGKFHNEDGCELTYAAHLDFLGGKQSRTNAIKSEILAKDVFEVIQNIQDGYADSDAPAIASKAPSRTSILFTNRDDGIATHDIQYEKSSVPNSPRESDFGSVSDDNIDFSSNLRIDLSNDQKKELQKVGNEATEKLRLLTNSIINSVNGNIEKWDTFYNKNGIKISELLDGSEPIGVICASLTVQASPEVVRNSLVVQPAALERSLEMRSILHQLSTDSYVQWVAYGAIWPCLSRDYLLITTENKYFTNKKNSILSNEDNNSTGFIISSCSIDNICDLNFDEDDAGIKSTFTRSNLHVGGYVGKPDGNGGTDLFLFVHLDNGINMPGWMSQLFVQVGIVEMMHKIEKNVQDYKQTSSVENNNVEMDDELGLLLGNIQRRETRFLQFLEDSSSLSNNLISNKIKTSEDKLSNLNISPALKITTRQRNESSPALRKSVTTRGIAIERKLARSSSTGVIDSRYHGKQIQSQINNTAETIQKPPSTAFTSSYENKSSSKSETCTQRSHTGSIDSNNNSLISGTPNKAYDHHYDQLDDIISTTPMKPPRNKESVSAPTATTPPGSPKGGKHRRSLSKTNYNDPNIKKTAFIADEALSKIRLYLGIDETRNESIELGLDWQLKVNKNNVTIHSSMVNNNNWQAIKAVTTICANKYKLVQLLVDDSRMGEYDDMFDYHKFLFKVDENTNVRRVCFKAVWPTAPRDFVICSTWHENPDGSILIATTSVPDEMCPPEKSFVRGSIQISGYHIQPYESLGEADRDGVNAGECRLTLAAHTELGGSLPASVINVLSTGAPVKIFAAIKDIISKSR